MKNHIERPFHAIERTLVSAPPWLWGSHRQSRPRSESQNITILKFLHQSELIYPTPPIDLHPPHTIKSRCAPGRDEDEDDVEAREEGEPPVEAPRRAAVEDEE